MCPQGIATFNEAFVDLELLQQYQRLCEWLLCFEAYTNESKYQVNQLDSDEGRIRNLMTLYKSTIARSVGNGLKLPKFHQVFHVPSDIRRLGPPREYNEGRPESSLKEFAKRPSEGTQKRTSSISQQSGTRMFEHLVIEHAYKAERG